MTATPLRRATLCLGVALCAWLLSGCVVGGSIGTLRAVDVTNPVDSGTADIDVSRNNLTLGTVFDFRAVRFVTALEMIERTRTVDGVRAQSLDRVSLEDYDERRVMRLDIPLLSLWDFNPENPGPFRYPGLLDHRHTLDVWLRGGTHNLALDEGGFVGGALVWYKSGAIAVSLTADYVTEDTGVRALQESGAATNFDGFADGWVVGFEVTLAAGEYALDIFKIFLDYDKRGRSRWNR